MRVPLYEGALLRMRERTLDDDGVSTECDAANSTSGNDNADGSGSSDATAGTGHASNTSDSSEEMMLMQWSAELRSGATGSREDDEEPSTIPARPPNSSDSSFSMPYGRPDFVHERAFDWLLTWGETRRHVADYLPSHRCRVFRQEILVHALSFEVRCQPAQAYYAHTMSCVMRHQSLISSDGVSRLLLLSIPVGHVHFPCLERFFRTPQASW